MTNRTRFIVSGPERNMIVAALVAYANDALAGYGEDGGSPALVQRLADAQPFDPADDGPEVEILRERPVLFTPHFYGFGGRQ